VSHPDPAAVPDTRPIEPGKVWENPVTLERAVLIEAPWWNDTGRAVADMTALPGGLARDEHVNKRGMPHPLQLALVATEFSDVIVFRKPPAGVQRVVFGALAPIARRRGYRATYPTLSRTTLPRADPAPRRITRTLPRSRRRMAR
jgi:hypothetical protein